MYLSIPGLLSIECSGLSDCFAPSPLIRIYLGQYVVQTNPSLTFFYDENVCILFDH